MKHWKLYLIIALLLLAGGWAIAKTRGEAQIRRQLDQAQRAAAEQAGMIEAVTLERDELAEQIPTLTATIEALEASKSGLEVDLAAALQTKRRIVRVPVPCGDVPQVEVPVEVPVEVVREVVREVEVPVEVPGGFEGIDLGVSARTEALATLTELGAIYLAGQTTVSLDDGMGWSEDVLLETDQQNSSVGVSAALATVIAEGLRKPLPWEARLGYATDHAIVGGISRTINRRWTAWVQGSYETEPLETVEKMYCGNRCLAGREDRWEAGAGVGYRF